MSRKTEVKESSSALSLVTKRMDEVINILFVCRKSWLLSNIQKNWLKNSPLKMYRDSRDSRSHRKDDSRESRESKGRKEDPLEDVLDHMWHALTTTKTDFRPLPGYLKTIKGHHEDRYAAGLDCDEVYPNIFIGDAHTARNKQYLQRIGITHVLNCAEGGNTGQVNTGSSYYEGCPIKYMGLDLIDLPIANIKKHFDAASEFIGSAVTSKGRILVHCLMGMSRSSACVVAYLMIQQGHSAPNALQAVRKGRDVRPNPGFMRQLAELELELMDRRKD